MSRVSRLSAIGAAVLLSCGAMSAHAQSSVKIYGLMDLNIGEFQAAGAAKTAQVSNGDFSTSFLGFGGKEDLGGGMSASFALESFFRPDTGRSGRVAVDVSPRADVFWARAANVTLGGEFGSVKIGRQTSLMFISSLIFNPYGDSFGFSPTIRHYYTSALLGDSGWSNALSYTTPNFSGFSASLQGSLGEGASKSVGKNFGGNVLYFAGPFAATAAYQNVKSDYDQRFSTTLPAGFKNQTAYQFGASYDLGVAKLFGQLGKTETDATVDTTGKIYQVGASAPLAGGKFLASFGNLKYTGGRVGTSKTTTLGYDYNLSKSTDVYAVYMNDKFTALRTGNTYAVGIRHKF
jgi:predicted porin